MRKCLLLLMFIVIIIRIEVLEQASAVEINLNEIALKIMGKNGRAKVEEKHLEKCQKLSAVIAWSILWDLELLKMENDSSIALGEENNTFVEEPKKIEQIEENIGRFYSEIQTVENFKIFRNKLIEICSILEKDLNAFDKSQNSHQIIELILDVKNGNWQLSKMHKFIEEFIDKNKFELELITVEFGEIEFNRTLKTDSVEHRREENAELLLSFKELEKSISQIHQLTVKLNAQNDINKMEKIANELATNANILESKWANFEEAKNLHDAGKNDRSLALDIEMNIIRELSQMQKHIKKWQKTKMWNLKVFYEKSIYGCLLKMTFTINLLKWKTENAMPNGETEIVMGTEARQLIIKLALLRRFLLSQINEKEIMNEDKQVVDKMKRNKLIQKLEQKFKWILRRQNRLADQMQRKEKKKFRSKLRNVLVKIREEFRKNRVRTRIGPHEKNYPGDWLSYSTFEGLMKRPLRQFYYGNEEKQTLKIRMKSKAVHTYVTLGNEYEYDYLKSPMPPRRLIFQKWKDSKLDENDKTKAQPIQGLRKFSVAEADAIFFGMPSKGWIPKNYSPVRMRRCFTYAYEFVCQLNGGKCPKEDQWPEPYRERDNFIAANEKPNVSVFSEKYTKNYHRIFNRKENEDGGEKCAIKELEIRIRMIKGEKWTEATSQKDANDQIQIWLPTFVAYDTGRFDDFQFDAKNLSCPFTFKEPLIIQEYLVKEAETDETIFYSALLKLNVCNVNGIPRAFVNNLHLLNHEMALIYAFGGVNLYEEDSGGHRLFTIMYGEFSKQIGIKNSSANPFALCEYK